ncbi:hypothetical protein LAZ67_20002038, partial [Cordylochernes scorpioides]
MSSGNTPSLARAESPSKAEEKPARLGSKAQPSAELPARNALKFNSSMKSTKNQRYANPATGGKDANPAAPTDFAAASSSEAAAQAHRNWAELTEDSNSEYEGNFTIVQKRKRRRGSANSSPAAAPSSNLGGTRTNRRPQSSAGWAPRAQEVRTTRAHIVEARARQASSTEDHCVYVERSPELEPYHYMRAMDRMFGSTREVFQVTKMNGHFLVGLANRGMAERLVNEGLEVEGTLHRVFPFRKRAERITVGNLPFFVGDAAVISALTPLGRVTSIAPKLMKAGPYTYNDGRREAFIILREGMTIEGLPTRLNITIKGEAWPAYLSSGIRCSRCRGQGHRRANCPLLAGRTNAPGPATPTSPTSVPSASAPGLPQQPSAQPPPPASPSPAMEVSEVPSTSRAALPPAAPRQSPPVAPAIPTEMAPPALPPVAPAPSLRAPGSHGPAVPTLDVEMSIEETSTFRAALKTSPAAVPPTPPLPAPQPAGPIPPAPDEEEMTPIMREECMVIEILKKLKHLTCLRPLYQSGIQPNDLKDAILFIDEKESLMARLTPAMRGVLAEFLSAAIEPARGKHPDVSSDLAISQRFWIFMYNNVVETPGNETVTRRSRRLQGLQPELSTVLAFPARKKMEREENRPFCHRWRDPTVFSGERGEDSQRWLSDFQRVARYNKWDDSMCLANVIFYLTGTAKCWFENFEEILNSWEEFKIKFCEIFGNKEDTARKAENILRTRAQTSGENVESYIQEVLLLCKQSNPRMSEGKKVSHLIKGVAEEVYQALVGKDISTVDQFVAFCRRFEAFKRMRVAPPRFNRLPNVTTISTAEPENLEALIRRIVREEVQKFMAPPSTFAAQDIDTPSPDLRDVIRSEIQQTLAPISAPRQPESFRPRRQYLPQNDRGYRRRTEGPPNNQRTQWRTEDDRPICFHCGRPGHVARYCRDRRQAFADARLGRETVDFGRPRTENYTMGESGSELSQGRFRNPSPYPHRGRFQAPRRTSQSPARRPSRSPSRRRRNVQALVDSGADYSVISEAFRRSIKAPVFKENGPLLRAADKKPIVTLGKCSLEVQIKGLDIIFDFVVAAECSHDVILGWDFFKATDAIIDCGENKLYLSEAEKSYEWKDLKLCAAMDCVIPPKSFGKIVVTSQDVFGSRDVVVTGSKRLQLEKGLFIPSSLVRFLHGRAVLWVTNSTHQSQVIPSDMKIGTMQDLEVGSISNLDACSEIAGKDEVTSPDVRECLISMISTDLEETKKNRLLTCLNEFSDIFDFEKKSFPVSGEIKHKIDTSDYPPVRQRPYRVSPAERRVIQSEVEKMMETKIIRPSSSPWASPVILVRKKDGSLRFCVDYRRLNKITKKDVYPLPRIDDALDTLSGSRYFSTMDMRSGYWQIEVDDKDREKTAFITPDGLYEFNVMPFGLCNAPATFERMIDNVLRGLKWDMCLCYLDDIVVYGSTFKEHLTRLYKVLRCIQQAGLCLNYKKCHCASRQITILGHVVNEFGTQPDPEKVKAIVHFPKPRNISETRSFLGLSSYYRRFIKSYANKSRPLNSLLKKDEKFIWGEEQDESFRILKQELGSSPVLGHFIEGAETHVHTDASGYGLGAVLVQIQNDAERPIAYASRTLTKAEKNYSTTEKECLAVVWALGKFRPYLYGRPFTVVTDHHSLCWLVGLKDPSGRLARWALKLQEYDINIVYKSGRKHKDADCLSRSPLADTAEIEGHITSIQDIAEEQSKDPHLVGIREKLANENLKGYQMIGGVLYKKNYDPEGKPWLLVVPKQMRHEILKDVHDTPMAGHLGFAKTYDRVRKRFYWPGLYRTVSQYIAHCKECQRRKGVPQKPPGLLVPIPPTTSSFQKIGIDYLGRFPISHTGNRWIIVATDYLTRFAITKAAATAEATELATFLIEDVILKHGAPREIITDRGRNFMSQTIREINNLNGTIHRFTTAYHPQTNGLTERLNKTLTDMISMYVDVDQKNWDNILPYVTFAYNTARQETTGYSPFFLVHGREVETPLDSILPYQPAGTAEDYVGHLVTNAEDARMLARLNILQAQSKDKERYDKKHQEVTYKEGDLVWVFTPVRTVGLSEKLLKRYFGPYRVIRKISSVNYQVEGVTNTRRRRKTQDIVHVVRMKPYHDPEVQEQIAQGHSDMESRLRRLENNVADVPVATPLSFRIADNSPQLETTECFSKIKPPTYDGQTSWKCFKTQFEVVALGNRWNSSEKAINLAASLRGSATEVLQSLPLEQSLDYERLIHALTLRFGDDILQPYHVVKLKNRRQKRDETLQELAADVERLARLAFPDCPRHVQDLLAHQNFVDAIEDPECQQSVRMSEAKTLQEALIHALKFEAARDATRGYQKVVRVVKTDEFQKDGDIKEAISQLQRTVKEMKKTSLTGPGLAMRCDDASGKIIRVSSLQGGSNELATEGLVNGLPCRMVIDSGANVTFLRVDLAQRMESISRRIPVSNELVLQTATGEQAKVYGQVVLKFQIGNNLFSHLGYLADIKDDCLIGLDVLRKFGFSIDFQENVLKIAGEEIPLVCSRSSATNKVLKVILKSDVKIPPRSECILEGRLTASLGVPQLLIVEENGQKFGQKGLLLARTLCKSDQSNIPIRVVNLLDSAKTLGKGTEIAIAEPVTNVTHCPTVENLDKSPCSSLIPGHLQELLEGTREGLNWIQQKKLEHLLCQYEDVFATSPKDVGRTNVTQHRIDTGGATPVKQLPRRLPMTRRDEVAKLIEEMAEQNVIEPSSSPWASPVVLVKKKDGSTRFCVDYRRLNDLTKKDSYPLPRIDATLDTLSGSQWFSTLDLKSGYWQVSIHPEDREKTAFTTGNGLWQFKVMPFGLCNAPATFERLMETVLQGIPLETCLVYLDDIIVMGKSFEEHLINLERVLQKIRGARLKLNPRKCKPFKEKVRYLGHVISRQGIQTDPDRTETVRQWPVPRDVHQLRSFLGLCSYYRRFVPGFSNIARPLHRLTESGRPFSWTIDCERAMDKLKQALSSPPMLAYPDPGEPFILDTDASNTGIGAVLSQTQDGVERVIAYFSKTLSKPERNHCVTRRELLAIVKSIEHFHHYLYGQKFLLRTDHAALRWLLNFKSPEGQLARWIQLLQEYDMEIQHRKGKSHGNADALSRRPCPVNCKHCSKAETQAELNIRQLSLAEEL